MRLGGSDRCECGRRVRGALHPGDEVGSGGPKDRDGLLP